MIAALGLLLAACGSSSDDTATTGDSTASTGDTGAGTATSGGGTDTSSSESAAPGESKPATAGEGCGLDNGEKATGDPVKVGNVSTSVPGIDFSGGPALMAAYFECVNENGGINGRPIELITENDNLKPEDAAAAARKIVESDKVVAVAGGFSILDCAVNADYYKEKGYYAIVAGVPAECFSSPNFAAANMGPAYSALGATQVIVEKGAKNKIVSMIPRTATSAYGNSLVGVYAKEKGLEWENIEIDVPIADPNAAIIDAVNRAGEGGGLILNFTPPEGLKLLKAAEEQGLIDKVVWGSSTPLNDNSVAAALGQAWAGKLNVNAELSLLDDPRPEMELYRQISKDYAPDQPLGSFQQMGFMIGRIVVHTLLEMDPADLDDPVKVNDAIVNIKNFNTDIVCKPWYYGKLDAHVPNNWDYNVVPNGTDIMELDKDCFEIAAVDDILKDVRKAEVEQKLNVG
ncbi:MAG: ABC transporter substrate-binding protein [Acidimicrobiia bacterium]|nr:ABC transporter substrate-binding protein [Acidimicrobiia bacterium]MDH4362515.1 ABC transporter substrate-binding protein [Acidimicrobiia bacterium]